MANGSKTYELKLLDTLMKDKNKLTVHVLHEYKFSNLTANLIWITSDQTETPNAKLLQEC